MNQNNPEKRDPDVKALRSTLPSSWKETRKSLEVGYATYLKIKKFVLPKVMVPALVVFSRRMSR